MGVESQTSVIAWLHLEAIAVTYLSFRLRNSPKQIQPVDHLIL